MAFSNRKRSYYDKGANGPYLDKTGLEKPGSCAILKVKG